MANSFHKDQLVYITGDLSHSKICGITPAMEKSVLDGKKYTLRTNPTARSTVRLSNGYIYHTGDLTPCTASPYKEVKTNPELFNASNLL